MSEANYKTHDLPLDEIILPVQQMFPNCQKYKGGCCLNIRINKMKQMELEHRGPSNYEFSKIFRFKHYPAPDDFKGTAPEGFEEGW